MSEDTTVVAEYPAYRVLRRPADSEGYVRIWANEKLGLARSRYYAQFTAGSVASYALQYNECPMQAVERAMERGHVLHWLNQSATVLSSRPEPRYDLIEIAVGMRVYFQGRRFEIESAPNGNLNLRPLAPAAA